MKIIVYALDVSKKHLYLDAIARFKLPKRFKRWTLCYNLLVIYLIKEKEYGKNY